MEDFDSVTKNIDIHNISRFFKDSGITIYNNSNNIKQEDVFIHKNIMSCKMAEWIIYESDKYSSENGGYTTRRHLYSPTTDLPVCDIPAVGKILYNFVFMDVLPIISKNYNMYKHNLIINDLFIVKYEHGKQDELEFHKDGSIISFNILLNDSSDFDGGGTIIQHISGDKLYESERCNLFMHSGKIKHSGKKITRGIRYILVGFISYISSDLVIKNQIKQKQLFDCI